MHSSEGKGTQINIIFGMQLSFASCPEACIFETLTSGRNHFSYRRTLTRHKSNLQSLCDYGTITSKRIAEECDYRSQLNSGNKTTQQFPELKEGTDLIMLSDFNDFKRLTLYLETRLHACNAAFSTQTNRDLVLFEFFRA